MSTIDETWTLSGGTSAVEIVRGTGDGDVVADVYMLDRSFAHARLIEQAPAMARCMLELLGESPCSPMCNHEPGSRHYCQADKVRRVLRAAGVLP